MTACIWAQFPAVILEIVQQASLRRPSFGLDNKLNKAGKAPQLMITWVWTSSPVTIFPTERNAGVWTEVDECLNEGINMSC